MTDIDINDFDGGHHWLSLKGKGGRAGIRAKHREAWEATHPRKPNPVRPETQARLERVSAHAKKLELARWIKTWSTAINIIDKSELEVRDLIERDLADLAGLSGIKYGEAMRAADKLSVKIKAVREAAIKQAFRYLRDRAGRSYAAHAARIARDDHNRIDKTLRSELIAGKDSQEIARKIIGNARLNGVDGVTEITRQQIARLGVSAIRKRRRP